ncbi:glycoside hydrolase family 43 protein [Deinococcus gobiensis]|uniref:glycoside hydrolase family 43 protein n=1 Tax=Deinococcus gobiensis TaxID=502394 RepID=UPI0003087006|nr:glycoside hydrolase family 43 protein [Deinococcus gobiensis]
MLKCAPALLALAAALPLLTSGAGGGPAPARTFTNPVVDANFPDPFILRSGGAYHAYATNGAGGNVPHMTSRDLVHWERAGDALPTLPDWVQPGLTWAPEVTKLRGQYVLYFTARDRASGRQCIGAAVSASPAGPFRGAGSGPLVCQVAEGGSIDASPFVDQDGRAYLLWKNDGNCCNLATHLYVQPLSADGLKLTGKATALIQNFALWEGNVIEAPTLYRRGDFYYLLYSAGPFDSDLYAVGYAVARKVTGPYRKAAENPILVSKGEVAGPGHQSVVTDAAGQTWLAYHAWTQGQIGDDRGYRSMRLDRISFRDGAVKVQGPTLTPQPAPAVAP